MDIRHSPPHSFVLFSRSGRLQAALSFPPHTFPSSYSGASSYQIPCQGHCHPPQLCPTLAPPSQAPPSEPVHAKMPQHRNGPSLSLSSNRPTRATERKRKRKTKGVERGRELRAGKTRTRNLRMQSRIALSTSTRFMHVLERLRRRRMCGVFSQHCSQPPCAR